MSADEPSSINRRLANVPAGWLGRLFLVPGLLLWAGGALFMYVGKLLLAGKLEPRTESESEE